MYLYIYIGYSQTDKIKQFISLDLDYIQHSLYYKYTQLHVINYIIFIKYQYKNIFLNCLSP